MPRIPTRGFLLNETAVRYLGWGRPQRCNRQAIRTGLLHQPGRTRDRCSTDFHLRTIHEEIEPIAIMTSSYHIYLLIRLEPDGISATISRIGEVWRNVDTSFPLEYTFLDEDFDLLYQTTGSLGRSSRSSRCWAPSCLPWTPGTGLRSRSSSALERFGYARSRLIDRQRYRSAVEGIYEIRPAGQRDCLAVGYFVMTRWLQNYAYAAPLNFAWFVAGGVVALIIAWLTIGAHAVAASRRNPVNALEAGVIEPAASA